MVVNETLHTMACEQVNLYDITITNIRREGNTLFISYEDVNESTGGLLHIGLKDYRKRFLEKFTQ